jgi:hypothetical protein
LNLHRVRCEIKVLPQSGESRRPRGLSAFDRSHEMRATSSRRIDGFDFLSELEPGKAVITSTPGAVDGSDTGYFLVELFQLPPDLPG